MIVTDEDRVFARYKAARVHELYLAEFGGTPHQIAQTLPFEETMYRGMLAECAFAHKFGLAVNDDVLSTGDDGKDFYIDLHVDGEVRRFKVNVKATSVRRNFAGMQNTTHLKVPAREISPQTIYVYGVYYEATDDADVLRWEWGSTLIRQDERRKFENGNVINYVRPYTALRELCELADRLATPIPANDNRDRIDEMMEFAREALN